MKLRVQKTSITLRILSEELLQLLRSQELKQSTACPGGFVEVIVLAKPVEDINFSLVDGVFCFEVPQQDIESWVNSSKIGYRRNYDHLLVVIEKDLPKRSK